VENVLALRPKGSRALTLLASTGERMSFHEAARQYDKKALQVIASILMDEKSELINHVARHRRVDFTSKLNETGGNFEFAGFPGQIKRVNRDARAIGD
jgi:hypothetical protein